MSKPFNTIIYSVTEALPAEGPLEGELKGYTGKCLEEYAGKIVLCRQKKDEWSYWSIGYFGEEDLWYDFDTDEVLKNVSHWMPIPNVFDPMFEEAL